MTMQQPMAVTEKRSGLSGRPFPPGTSGNPLGARVINERAAELYAIMRGDFGPLVPTDEILLRQAARLLARGERLKNADASIRMSSEARRIIASLRRTARAKDVGYIPLRDRLAAEFADENATSDEAEAVSAPADAADDAQATTPATDDDERTGEAETPPEGQAA